MALANPPTFTTEEHRHFFGEFIRWETAVGGPDPHLATLGGMAQDESWEERVWRCGLYASGYNVPTAEVIWQHWPFERMRDEAERAGLHAWIAQHWPDGFGLRRERRAVRNVPKFTRCLDSIFDWTASIVDETPDWWTQVGPEAYEAAWKSTGTIYGLGRYVQLKLVEALHRYADGAFAQTDIRARGGTSPREGLALLYPQHRGWLLGEREDADNVRRTEDLAKTVAHAVETRYFQQNVRVDYFTLQVVLCEYKKTWQGKQYPGRTHDTELRYWRAMQRYWGHDSKMLDARAKVFNPASLGEVQGWWGAREALEETLPLYRYTWSDLVHDYSATRDVSQPVVRAEPLVPVVDFPDEDRLWGDLPVAA